jgi:uncharacterized membrane protein YqaE (UPF0057 family)
MIAELRLSIMAVARFTLQSPIPLRGIDRWLIQSTGISLMNDADTNKLLLVIIAILLPPLAVGLKEGVGGHLILNIILCLLFWLPGLLHALYIVLR